MSVYICVCLIHMSSCIIYLSVIHMSQCVTYMSPICYSVSPFCHPHVTMCLLSSSMHDLYMCIRIYCPRVISMCTPAALLYTSWEHTLCKVTKKEDSIVNKVTAASLTGVTFKCTGGCTCVCVCASCACACVCIMHTKQFNQSIVNQSINSCVGILCDIQG